MLTWRALAQLPDADLAGQDVAAVNLACAYGLPGAEDVDMRRCLARLDGWTRLVRRETNRCAARFRSNPAAFENSWSYFRVLVLATVLQQDCGVCYDTTLIDRGDFFRDAANLFLYGVLGGRGGTCSSLPPVYVAVGRRLGYPLRLVLTRKDYMGAHEWCFYGWREGAAHQFFGPNNATDLWSIKKVNPQNMVQLTEKPVELAARALAYSSRRGEHVLDLFGGSGSTLIAAEQAGRRAFLMELDAPYCDVIVRRWERFTGQAACREATGCLADVPPRPRRGRGRGRDPEARLWGLARWFARVFVVHAEAWRLLCGGLKLDPEGLVRDLPGYDTVRRFEATARASAFTAEEALACLRGQVEERAGPVPQGVSRVWRMDGAEDVARAWRECLDEWAGWWA